MEARNSEPGLDIPQTRQRLEPVLTSAPQPLQAKTNIAAPSVWFSEQEHFVVAIIPRRKPAKVPISGGFCYLSFCTGVRWRLFQAEVGVSVIARPTNCLESGSVSGIYDAF